MRNNNFIVDIVLLVVGLLRLWRLLGGGQGGRLLLLRLLPPHFAHMMDLDDRVHEAAGQQDGEHHVQLHAGAQMGRIGVRDYEAHTFPQTVVREGRFLVPSEERSVQSCKTNESLF